MSVAWNGGQGSIWLLSCPLWVSLLYPSSGICGVCYLVGSGGITVSITVACGVASIHYRVVHLVLVVMVGISSQLVQPECGGISCKHDEMDGMK